MNSLRFLVALALASVIGCASTANEGAVCRGDHCVCVLDVPCSHDCTAGGEACEVQCQPGQPCDVGCAAGEHCHVECTQAASCDVDCGSSPDCEVTCPASGCTVRNCVGAACEVICGGSTLPSRNGSTATCR